MTGSGPLALAQLVHGGVQRSQLVGLRLLQLVDEDQSPDAQVAGRLAESLEQGGQVDPEVAAVGGAPFGSDVQADAEPPGGVEAEAERAEHGQQAPQPAGLVPPRGRTQGPLQLTSQRDGQGPARCDLHLRHDPAAGRDLREQLTEQDRLADAPKPVDDPGPVTLAELLAPAARDVERRELALAPGEQRRTSSGAGPERVRDGVHDRTVSASICPYKRCSYTLRRRSDGR